MVAHKYNIPLICIAAPSCFSFSTKHFSSLQSICLPHWALFFSVDHFLAIPCIFLQSCNVLSQRRIKTYLASWQRRKIHSKQQKRACHRRKIACQRRKMLSSEEKSIGIEDKWAAKKKSAQLRRKNNIMAEEQCACKWSTCIVIVGHSTTTCTNLARNYLGLTSLDHASQSTNHGNCHFLSHKWTIRSYISANNLPHLDGWSSTTHQLL